MQNTELTTKHRPGNLPFHATADLDNSDLNMSDVESRNMPSIGTTGWEITSILVILFILMGILYKVNILN